MNRVRIAIRPLGAIHSGTALFGKEQHDRGLNSTTHDRALAVGARAMGLPCWVFKRASRSPIVYSINGVTPVVDPTAYVHPSAVLIGDVIVGARCYIGPCASLRGDFGRIEVRAGANLQDACVAHGFPGTDTIVAEEGHVGHGAILHGCVVERNALIGMNAVVNDNAVIGESAIVAAMAFVKAKMIVPPRTLVAGVPARIVRALTEDRTRVEGRGHAKLPGAHAPQPRDDAGHRAARRRRARSQAPRSARAAAALRRQVAAD